jgi:integrase
MARATLLAYLDEAPATSGPLVRRYDDYSKALVPHYISDMVRGWMRDAGVKAGPRDGLSGHALRRTCATDLLDGGAHIRQVQEVLGHSSIQQTAKYLRKADAMELAPVMAGRTYRA